LVSTTEQTKRSQTGFARGVGDAECGEVRLFAADVHLGLAELLNLPGLTAAEHLNKARAIIDKTRYESRRARLEVLQSGRLD